MKTSTLVKQVSVATVAVIVVVSVLVFGLGLFGLNLLSAGQQKTTVTQTFGTQPTQTTANNPTCAPNSAWSWEATASPYSGDAALNTPAETRFVSQNGQLVQLPGNLGGPTFSSGTTGVSTAASAPTMFEQFTATNAYPLWVNVPTTPQTTSTPLTYQTNLFGQINYALTCQAQANGATNGAGNFIWYEVATLFQTPTNCASATTNCKAIVTFPTGSTPTAFPSTPTTYNFQFQLFSNYKAGMFSYNAYGTQANSMVNYATGATTYGSPVPVGGYFILAANQTDIQLSVNSVTAGGAAATTPSAIRLPIVNALAAAAWMIPLPACSPAPGAGVSSTNPYTCEQVSLNLNEATSHSHSISLVAIFIDNQQGAFIQNNFASAALASYPTGSNGGTSTAGAPTGFTFATPTATPNAGQPAVLQEQVVTVQETY